ncbi:MAG: 1-deoxy-D-xylulose-5-phosphate reductoisomerase [Oscillospiraceae bacterium]
MKTQCVSILGSTGSIGRQSLEVIAALHLSVAALTAHHDIELLEQQARTFHPSLVAVYDAQAAQTLKNRLSDTNIRVLSGMEGLLAAATVPEADTVVTAVVGIVGLRPTLAAIDGGKRIALANKETLVCAGELVMARAAEMGAEIIPVDSEHSAIFQCLQGCQNRGEVRRLILTASGGPFYGMDCKALSLVTKKDALKHPNWTMGAKVTIDSATLMNKGLELIEAMRLYSLPVEQIQIAVHRESIVHSLVEYRDGAILAQLGAPDMRLPIQFAFTYPNRCEGVAQDLDLFSCPPLTFARPDLEAFPCLKLAMSAAKAGGTLPAIMNGANEIAVARFLNDEIGFCDIPKLVERAMNRVPAVQNPGLDDILAADRAARDSLMKEL